MSLLHTITAQTAATAKRGRGWNLLYKSTFGREYFKFGSGMEHQNSLSITTVDALASTCSRSSRSNWFAALMMDSSILYSPFRAGGLLLQSMVSGCEEEGEGAFWWMSSTLKKRKKKMNKHKLKKRRKRERSKAGKKNA